MKRFIFLSIILIRVLTHDGFFLSQRRFPPKPQPAEIRIAIRRPWRKGRKKIIF